MRSGPAGIWLRGAVRRPGRVLTIVLTLAAMTVGTVAALVAADSLDQLFVADAEAEWAGVDVELTGGATPLLSEGLARQFAVQVADQVVAAAPRLILPGVAHAGDGRREPGVLVLGLGPEEPATAPYRALAGTGHVPALAPDEVVVNQRLATRLGIDADDRIRLVIGVPEVEEVVPGTVRQTRTREAEAVVREARVAGIVSDRGVADLHRTPNVLVRRDVLQRWLSLPGEVTHLHLSTREGGEAAADEVVRTLQPMLRRLGVSAATVRADALDIAEDEGGQFRSLLLILAAVVIAAAAVAAVQLLTALAEDRADELAILRVHGLRPRRLQQLLVGEATLLAVIGAVIGTVIAVPVAGRLAGLLADHFAALSAGRGREQVVLEPVVAPATVLVGVVTVLVAAALAGRAAARRLATVEVDVLLRGPLTGLPRPIHRPGRALGIALLGSLLLGSGLTDAVAADSLRYLGLTLLLAAGWIHRRHQQPPGAARARFDDRVALLALLWAGGGAAVLADFSQGYETGFGTLLLAGVTSTIAVTVLLTRRFRTVLRGLRTYLPRGRWHAALQVAGAAGEASPGRTGRLHATFGLVLFTAAALHVLGSAQAIDVSRQAGGFDVIATSVVRVEPRALATTPGVVRSAALPSTTVPEDRFGTSEDDETPSRVRYPVRLVGVREPFPSVQRFRLAEAAPAYDDARAAFEAVLRDGDKAVVDRAARPPGARIGDDVVLDLGRGTARYELIAVVDSFLLGSVFVAEEAFTDLVASPGPNLVLATGGDGTAPADLARRLEVEAGSAGLTARPVDAVAEDVVRTNRTFTDVFALMLLVGLAVALVAVAATLLRSTRQRLPELAVLSAIGLRRRHLVVALAAEPAVVAASGSVLGLAAGLAILRWLFAAGFSDLAFVVDVPRLAAVVGASTAAVVLVCLATAWLALPRGLHRHLRAPA